MVGIRAKPRSQMRQRGVGYLFMLFAVLLLSIGVGKNLEVYSTRTQRDREAELIEVGLIYREAIKNYYDSAPDGKHRYPSQLDDLLKDSRHLVTRRYLRQLTPDPITAEPFGVIPSPDGGIWGVVSTSQRSPLRGTRPDAVTVTPLTQITYADWRFIFFEE